MARPTKLLIVGTFLAALIGLAGWLNLLRLEDNLRVAVENCEHEGKGLLKDEQLKGLKFQLICEPNTLTKDLYKVDYVKPPGAQGQVVDAQQVLWRHSPDAYAVVAVAVFMLFSIPWLWYFFLHRLREISDAIRGR